MSRPIVPVTKYDLVMFVRTPKGNTLELAVPRDALGPEEREVAGRLMEQAIELSGDKTLRRGG